MFLHYIIAISCFCDKERRFMASNGLYWGKKLFSRLFLTLTGFWLLLLVALLVPRWAPWLIGAVLLFAAAGGWLGQMLLSLLSRRYPQLTAKTLRAPYYLIGVAGSGFQLHAARVPESWFGDNFVIRLTEAGRVARMLQEAGIPFDLMVSMPEHPELHGEKVRGVQAFLARFGVPRERITITEGALDSEDEMALFGARRQPVIIVSNSWHLTRLLLLGRLHGLRAVPAPAGQLFSLPKICRCSGLLPTAGNLQMLECALHEVFGIFWGRLKFLLSRVKSI